MSDEKKQSAKKGIKVVQFKKHWRIYNENEIAGFPTKTADDLIKRKIAVAHVK